MAEWILSVCACVNALYTTNSIKTGTITQAVFLKPKMTEMEARLSCRYAVRGNLLNSV
jgi:hypothetical protein